MSGATGALLALRWRMVRRPTVRVGLVLLLLVAVAALVVGAMSAAAVPLGAPVDSTDPLQGFRPGGPPPDRTGEVLVLLPSAMLAFFVTSLIGPIAAGGAYELIPASTLVAYPVPPRTQVRVSLLLSPLNIAWFLQLMLLTMATGYAVRGPYGPLLPLVVLLAFVLACVTVGQATAWLLVGVRRVRAGRVASRVALAALVVAALWIVRADLVTTLLDQSPTVWVGVAQVNAAAGHTGLWVPRVLALLAVAVAGYGLAVLAASWAVRRPGDRGSDVRTSAPLRRRRPRGTEYSTMLAMDRASVWRSAPLRRGLFVLGALPAAAGLIAGLPWSSIPLLPPLVASGAVLLFGVNAFCLDGPGAIWIATLPHDPAMLLRSKRRVMLEVTAASVAIVVVACAVRAPGPPTSVEAVSVLGSAVGCVALATAIGMRLSVTRPHRADLRDPRDTPAPPGSMALYSLRLASITTGLGLVFTGAAMGRSVAVPLLLTTALLAWSARSWLRTARRWADPEQRAAVVTAIASG